MNAIRAQRNSCHEISSISSLPDSDGRPKSDKLLGRLKRRQSV